MEAALCAEKRRQQQAVAVDQEYQQGLHPDATITQSYLQLNCINARFRVSIPE